MALARDLRVGIDLELVRPRPKAQVLANRFFAPAEARTLATMPDALREAAFLWPWLAFLLGLAFLAAYGWKVRGLFLPAVFAVGIVLAARTEAARLHVIDGTRFTAPPPPMTIRVESPVRLWRRRGWRDAGHARIPAAGNGPGGPAPHGVEHPAGAL